MADKPTTPGPAGRGRRKRPTPTIDLTATEVTAKPDEPKMDTRGQAGRPSQEQSAEAPSEAARESGPARGYDGSSQRGDLWQTLVAGCAGAALTTGALFALWFGGLVPARNGETVRTDFPLTAALNDRIARIEAAVARPQG
ncbi:MAG: hypothetical protein WA759_17135, partial [Pseudolabrys sp.]